MAAHYLMDCFFRDAYGVRLHSVAISASTDEEAIAGARGAAAGIKPSSFRLWVDTLPYGKMIFDSAGAEGIAKPIQSRR